MHQLTPPPRAIHLRPAPAPNQPDSPPYDRAPPPSWHLRAGLAGWPRPAARSIIDLKGDRSKWPTEAQLATAAAGEPARLLGRLGAPILRCSGRARLVFGSMLVVSSIKLISYRDTQDIDGSAGCYRPSSAVLTAAKWCFLVIRGQARRPGQPGRWT
eukprot:SAG22_NODE_2267_length_2763_cov_3.832584_4_plen_157_part_00